eukprot:Rhum_TRINITY_DN6179_c0_g1::Rhum_TRINITY_DN6179_c0_g1_i1::g.19150::m.19150
MRGHTWSTTAVAVAAAAFIPHSTHAEPVLFDVAYAKKLGVPDAAAIIAEQSGYWWDAASLNRTATDGSYTIFTPATRQYDAFARVSPSVRPTDTCAPATPVQFFSTTPDRLTAGAPDGVLLNTVVSEMPLTPKPPYDGPEPSLAADAAQAAVVTAVLSMPTPSAAPLADFPTQAKRKESDNVVGASVLRASSGNDTVVTLGVQALGTPAEPSVICDATANSSYAAAVEALNSKLSTDVFVPVVDTDYDTALAISTGNPPVVTTQVKEVSSSLALGVAPTLVGASQADAVVAAACVSARNVAVGPRLTNTSFHATAELSLAWASSPEKGSATRVEVRTGPVTLTLLSDATSAPVGAERTAWEGASGVCRIDSALVRGGNGGDSVTTVPVADIGLGPLISGLFSYQVVPAFGVIVERLTFILRYVNETEGVDMLIPHLTVATTYFQTEPFHSAILRVPDLRDRDATGTVGAKSSFLLTAAVRRSSRSPSGSEVLAFQREVRKPDVTPPGLGMGTDAKEFIRKAYEDGTSPVNPPVTIAVTRRYMNSSVGFVTEVTDSFAGEPKLRLMQRLPLRSLTKDTPLYPKVATTGTPAPDTPLPPTPGPTPAPTAAPTPSPADVFTGVCPIEDLVNVGSSDLTLSFQLGKLGGEPAIQFTVKLTKAPAGSYAAIGLRAPGLTGMQDLDVYIVDDTGSGAISDRNVDSYRRPAVDAESNAFVSLSSGNSISFYRLLTSSDATDFNLAPYVPPKGTARGAQFDITWAIGQGTADSITQHAGGSNDRGIIKGVAIAGCSAWYDAGTTPPTAEPDFVGDVTAFEALDADVTGYDGEAADALDVTPGAAEYRRLVFLLTDAAVSPRVLALSLFYNLAAAGEAAIVEFPVAPIRLSQVFNFTFFPAAFQTPAPAASGAVGSFFDEAFTSSSALNAYAVGLHVLPEAATCGGDGEAGLRGAGNASIALVRPFYAVSQWGLTRKLVLGTDVPDGYYELASTPAPTDVPPTEAPSMGGDTVSPEMNANETDIPETDGNSTTAAPDTPTPPERGDGVGGVFILPEWEGVAAYGGYQAGYNVTAVKAVGSDLYLFNHRDVLEDMSDQAGVPFTRYKGLRVAAAGYTRDEQRGLLEAGARATAAVGSGGVRHTAPVYVYVNTGSAPLNSYKGPAAGSIAAPRRNIVTAQDAFVVSPVLDVDKLIFEARQKLKEANGTTQSSTRRIWFVGDLPCKDAGPDGGDIFDPDRCQDAALSAGCIPVGDLLLKASLALRDDAQRDVKAVFATAEAYYVPDLPLSGTRSVVGRGMWIDGFCADIVPHNVTAADIEAVAAEDATKGVLQPLAFGLRGATTGPGLSASLSRYALGPPLDPGTVASTMLNYKYDSDVVASFANGADDRDYVVILWDRACQQGVGGTSMYLSDGTVLNTTLGRPAQPSLAWLSTTYPTLLVPRGRNVTYNLFPPQTAGSTLFPKRFQSAVVVRGVAAADRFARSVTEPALDFKALFSVSQEVGAVACRRLAVGNECDLEPCGTKAHCYDPDEAKQGDFTCTCAVSYEGEKSVGTKPMCVEPSKGVQLMTLIIIVVAGFCALVLVCGAFFGYRSRRSVNNLERNLRDSAEALTTQRSGFDRSRFTGWQDDIGRCETSIKQLERDSAGSRGMSSELKEVSRLYEAEYSSELASSDLHQRLAAVDSMSRDLSEQHASLGRGLDVLL